MKNYAILTTAAGGDYALLDSGDGEKLERYGKVTVAQVHEEMNSGEGIKRLGEDEIEHVGKTVDKYTKQYARG